MDEALLTDTAFCMNVRCGGSDREEGREPVLSDASLHFTRRSQLGLAYLGHVVVGRIWLFQNQYSESERDTTGTVSVNLCVLLTTAIDLVSPLIS